MGVRIGFIGLGAMGGPMSRRLLDAGHKLVVQDALVSAVETAARGGARVAASPAEVADEVEIVMVSLPTPDAVREVALGPAGLRAGGRMRIYADLSTTGARVAEHVAAGLRPFGVAVLDAPVSGGVAGASAGTLAIMASGDADAYETLRPLLEAIGSSVRLVGPRVGQGQTLKLVNNLIGAANYAAACECLVMGAKAGLDPAMMLDVVNQSTGRSFMTEKVFPTQVLTGRLDMGFRLELMAKDVRLALEEAEAVGASMFLGSAVRQLYAHALAREVPGADATTLVRVLEQWAGTTVRSPAQDGAKEP